MKIHHVGIVVTKIQDSIGEFTKYIKFDTIGLPTPIGSQKVNVCFLKVGEFNIELIETADENSPVSNFEKTGGGIHHICFEVHDIYKEIKEIVEKGATLVVKPVEGFENRLIAFVYLNMKKTNCNLIEFVEEKKG